MAKAAYWSVTGFEALKGREQTMLEIPGIDALKEYWEVVGGK